MPLFAIMTGKAEYLDMMLEAGASMGYEINKKTVDDEIKKKPASIGEVHAKHERWRRLRSFLKMQKSIGEGVTED